MGFDPDLELSAMLESLLHPQLKRISPGLERVEALLDVLGNPHQQLPPVIHIAGTNGKGSTLAFLQAILEAAGKRVHRYTSPHLVSFNERILVAGKPIEKAALMGILGEIRNHQEIAPTTFFESTTIAAFMAFARTPADIVLLETGLGGRLDATNVLAKPLAAIITPIGLDHQEYLGETIEEIAAEKAGILRDAVPAIIAEQSDAVVNAIKHAKPSADYFSGGRDWSFTRKAEDWEFESAGNKTRLPYPNLLGEHQLANAALAVATVKRVLPEVADSAIAEGLTNAYWPARLQPIVGGYWRQYVNEETKLWLDGAHNELGAQMLVTFFQQQAIKPTLIIAMKSDKNAAAYFEILKPHISSIITVTIDADVQMSAAEALAQIARKCKLEAKSADSIEQALQQAAKHSDEIVMCGSLYLAGEVLSRDT